MQVYLRVALDPASAPPAAKWSLPERWTAPLADFYINAFVYGLVFYLAGWLAALWFFMPTSAHFNRNVLFIAATGWIPFLYLYVLFSSWRLARIRRSLDRQQEAIEALENDLSDVIGEAVTMTVNKIQSLGPTGASTPDLDKYFGRH